MKIILSKFHAPILVDEYFENEHHHMQKFSNLLFQQGRYCCFVALVLTYFNLRKDRVIFFRSEIVVFNILNLKVIFFKARFSPIFLFLRVND